MELNSTGPVAIMIVDYMGLFSMLHVSSLSQNRSCFHYRILNKGNVL